MYNISFKERLIITIIATFCLMIVYFIITLLFESFRHHYWNYVLYAFLGGVCYQSIDALVYYLRHKKDKFTITQSDY